MFASNACAVQMLLVAFSRRMCCSRVCNARRKAGLPSASLWKRATMRPGQVAFEFIAGRKKGGVRSAVTEGHAEALRASRRWRCLRRIRRAALAKLNAQQISGDGYTMRHPRRYAWTTNSVVIHDKGRHRLSGYCIRARRKLFVEFEIFVICRRRFRCTGNAFARVWMTSMVCG